MDESLIAASSSRPSVEGMKTLKNPRKAALAIGAMITLLVLGVGGTAYALSRDDDRDDRPIPAQDRERAEQAALDETGGGRVTDTEVDDEESKYEVEVTRDDGTQVDVQLDENFNVVSSETDGPDDDAFHDD